MRGAVLVKNIAVLIITLSFAYILLILSYSGLTGFAIIEPLDETLVGTNIIEGESESFLLNLILLIGIKNLIALILLIIIFVAIMTLLKRLNDMQQNKLEREKNIIDKYKILLNKITPEKENFDKFSKIVRGYFKETLGLDYSLTYLELAKRFKENKKPDLERFCKLMSDFNYSGKNVENQDIRRLINYFARILIKLN